MNYIWLAVHLLTCRDQATEARLIIAVTFIGSSIDSMLSVWGIFGFENGILIPLWLITLWACFAATIGHSLSFLRKSKWLQWFVGTFIAPLSYVAGQSLEAVSFSLTTLATYMILAAIWGPLLIVLFLLQDLVFGKEQTYA